MLKQALRDKPARVRQSYFMTTSDISEHKLDFLKKIKPEGSLQKGK